MQAKYTYDEAYKATLEYFNGDELAAKVCVDKYLLRDNENNFRELTPDDMHWRIAKEFARIEKDKFKKPYTAEVIYSYLKDFEKIIPQGGPMYGIGNNYQTVSLSNCVVLPNVVDSYGGILKTDEEIVQLSKRRCGVGWDISNLRPKGLPTHNSSRTTTGIGPFMERFSNSLREVGQDGRRGAGLQSLNVHHPEIETFIKIKQDLKKVTGTNISVGLTDEFIDALLNKKQYEQRWPIEGDLPLVSNFVDAQFIFRQLSYGAWKYAEPGCFFLGTVRRESIPSCYKGWEEYSSNPCLSGKMTVKTKLGNKSIEELEIGEEIWSQDGWVKVLDKWVTGRNTIYEHRTDLGSLYCTRNHPVFSNGEKLPINEVEYIDYFTHTESANTTTALIKEIIYVGKEDTYDITVDNESHSFYCERFNVGNCGEIAMCDDCCRLIVNVLFNYVKKPFTKDAYFDYEEFREGVYVAQRLMDDLVDLELEKIDLILEKISNDPESDEVKQGEVNIWKKLRERCIQGRRTGLGQTSLADTLAAIGVGYGTKEGIETTDKIYKTMKLAAYRASVDMAKEIEAFPIWDKDKEKNNPFLLRIKEEDPKLWSDMQKWGRRNIALLTTSPAGTISNLVGPREYTQSSSGIEPILYLKHTRRKKGNAHEDNFRVDFVDQNGDTWQEFDVFHPKLKMWMDITGETDITKSPWYGYCAEDITWKSRIDTQAAAQRHVDHGISGTINLPEDISVEEVEKLYLYAYEAGLKGITVYRKGSRTGVIVEKNREVTKRPKELPCDIYKISVKGNHYFVVVGLMKDKPYEIFAGKNGIEVHGKHGVINKLKRKTYQLLVNGEEVIDSLSKYSNEDEEALTRMLSVSLRHGVDLKYVVHQLEKVSGDMTCFAKSIVRALKKYIPDGTEVTGEECPNCNNNELCREGGCITCKNCGWSKC